MDKKKKLSISEALELRNEYDALKQYREIQILIHEANGRIKLNFFDE